MQMIMPRSLVAILAFVSVCAGTFMVFSEWTRNAGLDFWSVIENKRVCRECEEDLAERTLASKAVMQRVGLKIEIANQLITGRVTLDEATEQFLELNQLNATVMVQTRQCFPSESDEVSTAMQVLCFARAQLSKHSTAGQEIIQSLEVQLDELREREAFGSCGANGTCASN